MPLAVDVLVAASVDRWSTDEDGCGTSTSAVLPSVTSLAWNPSSTCPASAAVKLFLAPRFPMRPIGGVLSRANDLYFGHKLVAQSGRYLGGEDWFAGIRDSFGAATSRDLLGGMTSSAVQAAMLIRRGLLSSRF